ncbi:MAG: ferritin family protein, partial [Deltaproteobacteria bacterium]
VKNIFIELREAGELSNLKISQIELYKKAQEIEKRSEEFYLKEADEVQDEAKKQTFRRIAGEESKHYFILENIINFVSSPEQWNESAEWYHLEEY